MQPFAMDLSKQDRLPQQVRIRTLPHILRERCMQRKAAVKMRPGPAAARQQLRTQSGETGQERPLAGMQPWLISWCLSPLNHLGLLSALKCKF